MNKEVRTRGRPCDTRWEVHLGVEKLNFTTWAGAMDYLGNNIRRIRQHSLAKVFEVAGNNKSRLVLEIDMEGLEP